jgi:DNA topoisomerase-1
MNKLIIAEKPSVASRLALSLGDGQPRRGNFNGVNYYEVSKGGETLYIVAAAGHLFTIRQKTPSRDLPIFDIEWIASYKVSDSSYFTKKYLDTIAEIGKKCTTYVNACDYDIEGTVIGTNIIKYVTNGDVNSIPDASKIMRMRFSTTTREDLLNAYANLNQFDSGNFDAGEARHILDWMWGINLSRALIKAITSVGAKKILSIGRVQGPTLGVLAARENEIKEFKPRDFWRLLMHCSSIEFENRRGNIFEKETADQILEKVRGGEVKVKSVDRKENQVRPYPPFDLTSLQLEASRVFGIDPSRTLAIAQSLYERSYISYPRTTSQKLPYSLNLPRIINMLAKADNYKALAERLIKESRFRPAEGMKEDEAHPAIYPTGEQPKKLTEEEDKIYDLITKRFLSCFAEYATLESTRITLDASGEEYAANGSTIKKRGWLEFYGYYKPAEATLPGMTPGNAIKPEKIFSKKGVTEPPKRYSKASLIALLEKKNLGTKATRSEIIDTLFRRTYIKGARIEVTGLGMSVYRALREYCGEILDEDMTRKLESDMEGIAKGTAKEQDVIKEGEDIIKKVIGQFKTNEKEIGMKLKEGLVESEIASSLGKCLKDGGMLVIKRSGTGKNFVGCSSWPNCDQTYPLPQGAMIVPTGKICDICHTPIVKVFRRGKRPFQMDLDPNCETKKDWAKPKTGLEIKQEQQQQQVAAVAKGGQEMVVQQPAAEKKVVAAPTAPQEKQKAKRAPKKTAKPAKLPKRKKKAE